MSNWIRSHRTLVVGGLLAGICFMLGLIGASQLPKVRSWVLVTIEKTSRERLPVRILPGAVDVHVFLLGTTLRDVKIVPKPEVEAYFDPVSIGRVQLEVSFWQLLQGRLRLTDVELEDATIVVRAPKAEKRKSAKPLEGVFDLLQAIPVNRLALQNISVRAAIADPSLRIDVDDLFLEAEKRRGGLQLKLETGSAFVGEPGTKGAGVRGETEIDGFFNRSGITLAALKFRRGESFVVGSGTLSGDTEGLTFPEIDISARSEWHLESTRNWAAKSLPQARSIPPIKGRAFLEGKLARQKGAEPKGDFKLRTVDLAQDKLFIGEIKASGTIHDGKIQIPDVTIENSAGRAKITEVELKLGQEPRLAAKLSVPGLQINELLRNLGVGKIPVWMQVTGELPCTGQLKPAFLLTCKGTMRGENLLLRGDMKSKGTLVALRGFDAAGTVTVDQEKVTYEAELAMPNSKGRSKGTIGYATGFDIDFEADKLAIADITNVVDLKLEGAAKIKGNTKGDASKGVVSLDLDGTDIWLEDWWLGNAKTNMSYKDGVLSFASLQGYHTVSRYSGEVKLDLRKSQLAMNARIPFFDTRDLLKAVSRKTQLPFPITGTGQAQIRVSGPLQFNRLSYDLRSTVFKGSVAGETFDQAHFDLKSVGGEVRAERVMVVKGPATIQLTGEGHPNGNIETVIRGRGLRIEDTSLVLNSGLALSGVIDFDMDLKGYVLGPDTTLKGTLTKTAIGDQGMPDSRFAFKFTSKTLEGSAALLGDVVKAELVLPLDKTAPFRLKASTQDWNFAPLFLAIAGPGSRKNYEGRLTTSIDLASASGGFWNSTGTIAIDKFSLTRGTLSLRSPQPLAINMKDGNFRTQKFELVGDNIFLRVSDNPKPSSKLDLQINGKLDLSLIALLTPFFEDLRGLLSFSFNIRGGESSLGVLGSAYVDKGYLKFFDFPHPFEDVRADVLFNQKKILFNSLRAEFGGGRMQASGGMELKGSRDYPLNLTGTFDKITLNVPDKMRTTGSGEFSIAGAWFPYVLKGSYDITDGLMSKDFGGDSGPSDGIRRDNYLPEFLLQDNFVPLVLDLEIGFTRGLAIKNELVEGRALGQITVRGKPTKASILGSITTDKETRITFRDTIFEVTASNIQFLDPNEINPKIYVAASARVQNFDVNLLIQGTGRKPEFSWSSVPQLPEKEIISLLALGATDSQLDQRITGDNQSSNTALQIGTGMIKNNPVSNLVKDKLGFDVQFSTGYDDTGNTQQKVIVSKQFSNVLGVSGSRAFGGASESEARLRYRLNDKISVMGVYQGRDFSETSNLNQQQRNPDRIGADIEYRVEFK